MIVEWLGPVSGFLFGARLLRDQLRASRHQGWEALLKLVGAGIAAYAMVRIGFEASGSLGESLVVSAFMLTMAFLPARIALRLIRARRPNEIEDPEMFENGELKPDVRFRDLSGPKRE